MADRSLQQRNFPEWWLRPKMAVPVQSKTGARNPARQPKSGGASGVHEQSVYQGGIQEQFWMSRSTGWKVTEQKFGGRRLILRHGPKKAAKDEKAREKAVEKV